MSKLSKQYITLGEFLTESLLNDKRQSSDIPIMQPLDRLFRIRGVQLGTQMKGSLQSFADMKKDLVDTFKPYRSNWYAKRDAKQPFYGIYNFFKGIGYILGSLLLLIAIPFYYIPERNRGGSGKERYFVALVGSSIFAFSWFTDGVLSVIRGVTQLVTTPWRG